MLRQAAKPFIDPLRIVETTIIDPTFEENGILVLGVVFFIQSTFANQNNSF